MINNQLLKPASIVIVGGSDDIHKPGGKILYNIIKGKYNGKLYVSNPKKDVVQGIKSFKNINDLPETDLAILAIPAKFCPKTVKILTDNKKTKAFIILSAGFSETSKKGAEWEQKIVNTVNRVGGVLIGPNGIGMLTPNYHGVFTSPVPKLDKKGVDFISGSGATAVFIMELGIPAGLRFANVYSVGNSAQTGVEEVLEYMDNSFDKKTSPTVKMLYLEQIENPKKLLKHASSLIRKGCKIAAIKSGCSNAGSRAASSHTGALATSDLAVDALFKKAGIVRCNSRLELINVASAFMYPELKGKNIAIITHAGGPAVMLSDALEKGNLNVPEINNSQSKNLLEKLFSGSSVTNPIDFLATGTAEQLGLIIDYCENYFYNIDAMIVIFGTPGLTKVFDAYKIIEEKIKSCKKPIYPVLPSINMAKKEIDEFISTGLTFFPEEVLLGNAISKIFNTPKPTNKQIELPDIDKITVRKIIENSNNGYLSPQNVQGLLDAAGINRVKEAVADSLETCIKYAKNITYPIVMKVVGPVHKSDVGGVVLNVKNEKQLIEEFERMIQIKDTSGILLQQYLSSGTELFAGAKYEDKFGHLILAGLGGIYIEILKDVATELSPIDKNIAKKMIKSLKSYSLFEGVRGQKGINEDKFADILTRLSALLEIAPEIKELDMNPLLGTENNIITVDARIRILK